MEIFDLLMLGIPVAFTVAKLAVLAMALVFAVRGIFRPYGLTPLPRGAVQRPARSLGRIAS